MDFILCGSIFVVVLQATRGSDYLGNETGSGDDIIDYYGPVEYMYEDDYEAPYQICTEGLLKASTRAKALTLTAQTSKQAQGYNQWTIVPSHKGGVVAVTMIEYTVGTNLFTLGCSDIQVFESGLNSTISRQESPSWCRKSRLLPCDMSLQMAFYFGYVLRSTPSNGINVVHTPAETMYDYDTEDKISRMYYYECGGRRTGGEITSPTFPYDKQDRMYTGHVSCKWELRVGRFSDYGILRFTRFSLPRCESHYLLVEEDTVFKEEDVTDELLAMLDKSKTASKRSSESEKNNEEYASLGFEYVEDPTEETEFEYYDDGDDEKEKNSETENKYTFFYRQSNDKANDTNMSLKSGVHAVVITKYCGNQKPSRTMYWRRGSKDVTLTFVSENGTSSDEGFEAKYSVFSWEHTMNQHRGPRRKAEKPPKRMTGVDILLNYIVVIVFIPIGVSIGLGIIIFHIKKRGPTLRDFYKKEKRERQRLQRAKTERVKSVSPRHARRSARRTQSLDLPQSPLRSREFTESMDLSRPLMECRPVPVASRMNSRLLEGVVRLPPTISEGKRFPTRANRQGLLPARDLLERP